MSSTPATPEQPPKPPSRPSAAGPQATKPTAQPGPPSQQPPPSPAYPYYYPPYPYCYYPPPYYMPPPMPRQPSSSPTVAGALCITGGATELAFLTLCTALLGGTWGYLWSSMLWWYGAVCLAIPLAAAVLLFVGGALAILRKNWTAALVCGIIGSVFGFWFVLPGILGIIGVIFLAISKDDFVMAEMAREAASTH